jgi:uncharacterized membrane protein YkvA (DUF1232 family)
MFARLFVLFRAVGRDLTVLWYACRQSGTPLLVKVCALLLALYIVNPIDVVTDFLPLMGWIDDAALLALGVPALLKLVPVEALERAREDASRLLSRLPFGQRGA